MAAQGRKAAIDPLSLILLVLMVLLILLLIKMVGGG